MSAENDLTSAQRDDLRTVAAMIIPASDEYKVPGADDAAIQADILATLGRDTALVAQRSIISRALPASRWPNSIRRGATRWRRSSAPPAAPPRQRSSASCCNATTATTACCARSGWSCARRFRKGYALEQGDWSLLDPVKARPPTLRRA